MTVQMTANTNDGWFCGEVEETMLYIIFKGGTVIIDEGGFNMGVDKFVGYL